MITRREILYFACCFSLTVAAFTFGLPGLLVVGWLWFVVGLWFALVAIAANPQAFLDGLKVAVMAPLYLLLCAAMLFGVISLICGLWSLAAMPVASMPVGALFCLLLVVLGVTRH
jgi:hypothetical protein